jgi:hypothetical protein
MLLCKVVLLNKVFKIIGSCQISKIAVLGGGLGARPLCALIKMEKMNLKKATIFLIVGSAYTLCHKAIFAIFPFLPNNFVVYNILAFLWLIATLTIILFAFYFPKEVTPLNKQIKISLKLVILFTSIIILLKLPFVQSLIPRIQRNIFFEFSRLLNSIAMLVFWFSFYKIVHKKFQLHNSIKLIIWETCVGVLLELISFGYHINFIFTGIENIPFPPLKFFAVIAFVVSYFALINFLIKFKKVDDYKKLVLS